MPHNPNPHARGAGRHTRPLTDAENTHAYRTPNHGRQTRMLAQQTDPDAARWSPTVMGRTSAPPPPATAGDTLAAFQATTESREDH